MLNFYGSEELFLFIPEVETEAMEELTEEQKKKYKPFSILHKQMDNDTVSLLRSITSRGIEQVQEMETGKGKKPKTVIRNNMDFDKIRDTNLKIAKTIVVKATNFDIKPLKKTYPVLEGEKVVEEWCIEKELLDAMLERLNPDLLSELINQARDVSTLTPYEKKR